MPLRLLDWASSWEEKEQGRRRDGGAAAARKTNFEGHEMDDGGGGGGGCRWMDGRGRTDWRSDARVMCPDSKDFCTSSTTAPRGAVLLLIHPEQKLQTID